MTPRAVVLLAVLALGGAGLSACGEDERAATGAGTAADPAAAVGGIGDATTADAEEGGAEEESAPDVGELEGLPEEGVGSGQTQCPADPAEVSGGTVSAVRSGLLCLVNAERTSRGLKPLRTNARLQRAGDRKAADMVRRKYFSHDTPDGRKFTVMIRQAGYFKGARRWSAGENLAWGGGARALPAQTLEAWLASPPHRANLLSRKWREVGIGIALGTPTGASGATYAAEFGKLG